MSPYCSAQTVHVCRYHDANNVSNFSGDPVTQLHLKNVFVYEIGLIAIREVSPRFDEEHQYGRPYQPKHSPSTSVCIQKLHKDWDYYSMYERG